MPTASMLLMTSLLLTSSLLTSFSYAQNSGSTTELVKPSLDTGTALSKPLNGAADKIVKFPTPADDERTARILNNMASQSGWFPQLKLNVSNGLVTIEGRVKDADQLAWLAKTADRLPTVIAVINKAQIDQPAVTDLTPAWNEFTRLVNRLKRALPLLALTLVLLGCFLFLSKYIFRAVGSLWRPHIGNPFLLSTMTKLSMIPIWVLFFYLALQTAGLSALATTIIGGTGIVGIVLGFAFKEIAENYLSGLLLAIRSPFTKGDDISAAGYDGYVQSLNMRGTTILEYDGNLVLIPNSMVISSVIRNRTTSPQSRVSFIVGIGYNDSVTAAQDLILEALQEVPAIVAEPAPFIVATELTSSTVNLQVYFWMDSVKNSKLKTKSAAISRSKEILLAHGISLPDDAREVVFTDALKIQMLQTPEEVGSNESAKVETARAKASAHLDESKATLHEKAPAQDDEKKKLGPNVDILERSNDASLLSYGNDTKPTE